MGRFADINQTVFSFIILQALDNEEFASGNKLWARTKNLKAFSALSALNY